MVRDEFSDVAARSTLEVITMGAVRFNAIAVFKVLTLVGASTRCSGPRLPALTLLIRAMLLVLAGIALVI